MKKYLTVMVMLTVCFMLFPLTVFADMGPKPAETVTVTSPPDEPYYLDLLIRSPGSHDNLESDTEYNEEMLALLHSFEDEGWYPALAGGTGAPLFGDLTGEEQPDGSMRHHFSYFGVPDTFRIILVTESGEVRTSDVITRTVLQSSTVYDYTDASEDRPVEWILFVRQFLATCIPTLVIELLLLMAFRFSLKKNILPVLAVNLATQIFLSLTLGRQIVTGGPTMYFLMLIPLETVIFAAEMLAFIFLLQGQSRRRRAVYAFTANLASMAAGIIVIEAAGKFFYSI